MADRESNPAAGLQGKPEPVPIPSDQERLKTLIAQATAKYAIKDYLPAAEFYSQATELQAELNGEMALENAELLYSYGKCLYFVAVKNSDVLGGEAAGAKLAPPKEAKAKKTKKLATVSEDAATSSKDPVLEGEEKQSEKVIAALVEAKDGEETDTKAAESTEEKPFFQFTGDENWDDSDEDSDAAEADEPEEEDDDFANAFELLDLARILFQQRLTQLHSQSELQEAPAQDPVAPPSPTSPDSRTTRERIADIHDLQAEIALESERFPAAVTDLQSSLALKTALYPLSSPTLAECHYKLSLALEFASLTQPRDGDGNPAGEPVVDPKLRFEAEEQMGLAIASCRARVENTEQSLAIVNSQIEGPDTPENLKLTRDKLEAERDDVREMIGDMELRLAELRKGPAKDDGDKANDTPLAGLLGQILGEGGDKDEQRRRLEQASVGARDLSGLVKRKEKEKEKVPTANGSGKRKVESLLDGDGDRNVRSEDSKKARVEDVPDGP